MKACIWFSENSEFWWFAFVREVSARSKFEYWVSISQFYHLHMFCKMLVHKIHWFFFSWMVSFLLFLICRSALFIIDSNTLLVTYVAMIFQFAFFHYPQKIPQVLYSISHPTFTPIPKLWQAHLCHSSHAFCRITYKWKKVLYIFSYKYCVNTCYYFSCVIPRRGVSW